LGYRRTCPRSIPMKLISVSAVIVIAPFLLPKALGQESPSHKRLVASFQHVDERSPAYPHGKYTRAMETNCHPSRGAMLRRTIEETGTDPVREREVRARITAIRSRMTAAEKKETAKLFRIQANRRKYLAQQAKKEQRVAERERGQSSLATAR